MTPGIPETMIVSYYDIVRAKIVSIRWRVECTSLRTSPGALATKSGVLSTKAGKASGPVAVGIEKVRDAATKSGRKTDGFANSILLDMR